MIQILSRMDFLLLVNIFRHYSNLKLPFRHNSARKHLFLSAYYVWNDRVSLQEVNQSFHLVDSLVVEIVVWTLYFVTPKYSDCTQYYTMLLEQFDYKPVKDVATAT